MKAVVKWEAVGRHAMARPALKERPAIHCPAAVQLDGEKVTALHLSHSQQQHPFLPILPFSSTSNQHPN